MEIDIVEGHETVRVIVGGEVDLAAQPRLDAALAQAATSAAATIVIDLDRVSFLDAAGLGVIARHALAAPHGERVRLTRGSRPVRRLLELTGMDRRLRRV